MNMLDDAAWSALAAVVREGSFERAARALGVTPPRCLGEECWLTKPRTPQTR